MYKPITSFFPSISTPINAYALALLPISSLFMLNYTSSKYTTAYFSLCGLFCHSFASSNTKRPPFIFKFKTPLQIIAQNNKMSSDAAVFKSKSVEFMLTTLQKDIHLCN
jgi:hypothetical protein